MFGLLIYALSTLFTTLMSITAKLAGANGMPVMVITFVRGAVVLLFSIPPLIMERANPVGNRVGLLLVRGVLGWASGATLYASVQYLPISDATVLSFLSPVWVALTSPLLIKEIPSRYVEGVVFFLVFNNKDHLFSTIPSQPIHHPSTTHPPHPPPSMVWAVLPACIGGVLLVSQPTFLFKHAAPLSGIGVLLGCLQAIISGSVRMVVRELRTTDKPSVVIFHLAAMTVVLSTIGAYFIPHQFALPRDTPTLLLLIATGLFAFGNQMTLTHGLRYAKASTCTALSYLSILWAEIASIALWNEYPGVLELTGATIIGVCTALLTIFERRKSKRAEAREARALLGGGRDDSAEGLSARLLGGDKLEEGMGEVLVVGQHVR